MINLELREPFETVEEFKKEAKKHKLPYKIFDLNGNSYTVEIGNGKIFIKEKGRNFFSYELFSFTFDDGTPCGKVKYNNKELNKRIDRLCYLMQKFKDGKVIKNINGINLSYISKLNLNNVMNFTVEKNNYRPFNSYEECLDEIGKHKYVGNVIEISSRHYYNINSILKDNKFDINIDGSKYYFDEVFNKFTFVDGEPFGKKIINNIIYY